MIEIAVCVGFWLLHVMFSHEGDIGEAYECDRRRDIERANLEFNAFVVVLWTGIALFFCWAFWKGFVATERPTHHAIAQPIRTAAAPKKVVAHPKKAAPAKAHKTAPTVKHAAAKTQPAVKTASKI
jgi:hypothetical protein